MNFHHLAYWQDKALSLAVLIHEKYEKYREDIGLFGI